MKKDKWLSITCSRNDGDFIEAFVRGNSRYIDKFVIVDDSTDNTVEILKQLRKEGYDIEIVVKRGIISDQKAKTNWMFQRFANPNKYSAVIPLDVDEIVIPKTPADTKDNIRLEGSASFLDWIPFVPTESNWPISAEGLRGAFLPAVDEIGRVKKIFLPLTSFIEKGVIEVGAHNYHIHEKPSVVGLNTQLGIAHFPVRSNEQLISKLSTYMAAVRLKKNKAPGESLHLPEIVKMVIRTDFSPTIGDLQSVAANYGSYLDKNNYSVRIEKCDELANNFVKSLDHINLRYNDLARVNLIKNLYELSTELTDQLVSEFGMKPKIDRHYRVPFRK